MNINFTDLEKLIKLAECADIESLEVTDGDARISIVCQSDNNQSSSNHIAHTPNPTASHSESQTKTTQNSTDNNTNVDSDCSDKTATIEVEKSQVIAPMLGTFYLRSEPTAEVFFQVGDKVEVGQTLCIIEAMKMMYEVKAETACTLQEILVDEGDVVEYAQPLFVIEPNS